MEMPPVWFRASLKLFITNAAESSYNGNFLSWLFCFFYKIRQIFSNILPI